MLDHGTGGEIGLGHHQSHDERRRRCINVTLQSDEHRQAQIECAVALAWRVWCVAGVENSDY